MVMGALIATDRARPKLLQRGNSKLKQAKMMMFNLPATKEVCGRACPSCYARKEQARYSNVLPAREVRLEQSKLDSFAGNIAAELSRLKVLPKYLRVHASGEFYSQEYIDSWLAIAKAYPEVTFYAYTKRLKEFDFSGLLGVDNFIIIDSMHFGKINYGKKDKAPKGAFICPDRKGLPSTCGTACTWCQTKGQADKQGVWFIEH